MTFLRDAMARFPLYLICDEPRSETRWHRQPGIELNLTREGYGRMQVDRKHFTLEPGTLILLPAGASHQMRSEPRGPYVRSVMCVAPEPDALQRNREPLNQALAGLIGQPPFTAARSLLLTGAEVAHLHALWQRGAWEMQLQGPWLRESVAAVALETLVWVARLIRRQGKRTRDASPAAGLTGQLARDAASYVRRHVEEDLSTERMADLFHVSREHLTRAMNREYGVSFHRFVMAERIAAAKRLLLQRADWNLLEVALATGFQSHAHFSRVFRQVEGMTPSAYRALRKEI